MVLCALLAVLHWPFAAQSYSISEEQITEIVQQTEIMKQSMTELKSIIDEQNQQLQELNKQLIESQKSLKKSKKINSVLGTVIVGMAAGTITMLMLK